jgi:hypothetical protein
MNDRKAFRLMMALASVILVSMLALAFLAGQGVIHGLGLQEMNQTATASFNISEEVEDRLFNFTSRLIPR